MISSSIEGAGRNPRQSDTPADKSHAAPESIAPIAPSPAPCARGPLTGVSERRRSAPPGETEPGSHSALRSSASGPNAPPASGAGSATDEDALEQYGQGLAGKLSDSTIKGYRNCLRSLSNWLAEHHPEAGGLTGIEQADENAARAWVLEYRMSSDLSEMTRKSLKPAVDALRARRGHTTGPSLEQSEADEIILKRFRDAAHTRMTPGSAQGYESHLRGFGYWLAHDPEIGGLAAIESADENVVTTLLLRYRTSPTLSVSARRNIKAAVDALRSRLSESDETVLKRFGNAAGPGTTIGMVRDRQSQLRAFCVWLKKRDPETGGERLLYVQQADEREVGTLVAEYCDGIGRESPHGSRIAGAIDALRSIGVVLDHYGKAARDSGEPENPLDASQSRLSAFSFWLAQHHLQAGGLAGVMRTDPAEVDTLLHAYSQEAILRKELAPKAGENFKRNIESAVDALRAYCRDVGEADQCVLDQYGQAARRAGVLDAARRRNLIYLRCFSLWLEDHHRQGVGLADIQQADQAQVETLIGAYCRSADSMSPRRQRTHDAIHALRLADGRAIDF